MDTLASTPARGTGIRSRGVVRPDPASYNHPNKIVPHTNASTRPPDTAPPSNEEVTRIYLRFGDHDVELHPGETILGRGPKSNVVLDDALVSRKHAKIILTDRGVTIEDLGSANGVIVNGERCEGQRALANGDRVVLGHQSFILLIQRVATTRSEPRVLARTVNARRESIPSDSDRIGPTRRGDAFELLCGVAEKMLALGRADEAERILASYLRNMLQMARARGEVDLVAAEKAVAYAVRIGETSGKGMWIDYAFDMYAVQRRPLPAALIERLYEIVRKASPLSVNAFRQYLLALRSAEQEMGPADRFLVRRIEGLEAFVAPR